MACALPAPVNTVTVLQAEDGTAILVGLASGETPAYDDQGRLRAAVHAGDSPGTWRQMAAMPCPADVVAGRLCPAPVRPATHGFKCRPSSLFHLM